MRCVAIANQKGGAAKTTTTVNLAAALGALGRKVLVIDLDPQGNSTDWLDASGAERGVFEFLANGLALGDVTRVSSVGGVSVIAATRALQGAERALAREVGAEMVLQRKLRAPAAASWDYVLIDTPPTLGILTLNALTAASELIVPVEAHVLALAGVAQLMETVETVRERLNPALALAGLVACRVDSRTRHSGEVVDSLRRTFSGLVYASEIRENIRLAEAPSFRQSILDYDTRSSGAADYRALAAEVMRQENSSGQVFAASK
jgi:chromosome partitioning protein